MTQINRSKENFSISSGAKGLMKSATHFIPKMGQASFRAMGKGLKALGKGLAKNAGKLMLAGAGAAALGVFGRGAQSAVNGAIGSTVGSVANAAGQVLDSSGISSSISKTANKIITWIIVTLVAIVLFGILIYVGKLAIKRVFDKKTEYPPMQEMPLEQNQE